MHSTAQHNALDYLRHDHRRLKDLFDSFEESEDLLEQKEIVDTLIRELNAHMQVEESIFYAAMKEAVGPHHVLDQAEEEHQEIRDVITDLQDYEPEDPLFADKLMELEDKVRHHLQQEESELFTQAEDASLPMDQLGKEMQTRKNELTQRPPTPVLPGKMRRRPAGSRKR